MSAPLHQLYEDLLQPVQSLDIAVQRARDGRRAVATNSLLIARLELRAARDLAQAVAGDLERRLAEIESSEGYLAQQLGKPAKLTELMPFPLRRADVERQRAARELAKRRAG